MTKKYSFITRLLLEFTDELNIEVLIEPEYGYAGRIKTKSGKVHYYHSKRLDINPLGASEIAKDKTYTSFFLKQYGYPVPEGDNFYSDYWCKIIKSNKNISQAITYAEKLGYPLIVKPNSESEGRGVEKVFTREELVGGLNFALNELKDNVAIVQRIAMGKDYRIVVLDDEVICAYHRTPLTINGDGKNTIAELLADKQKDFIIRGRDTVINPDDPRISRTLSHANLTFNSIPAISQKIQLLSNANLSSGGEAEDITAQLHEDYKKMAVKLTSEMGLRFCGIDIITPSPINQPMKDYFIIEINSAPGLDYYAEAGEKQKQIVKKLYKKLFTRLIA